MADEDNLVAAKSAAAALDSLGHQTTLFEVNAQSVERIGRLHPDFILNLAEGIGSLPNTEYQVVKILEGGKTPFSGSGSETIRLTTDKAETKKLLVAHGLKTPPFQVLLSGQRLTHPLPSPVIIKPVGKDGSIGINGHSVLVSLDEIYDQVDFVNKAYQEPALVEQFIDGRELNVTVLGSGLQTEVLPVSEIVFGPSFASRPKVVDFSAKWEQGSPAYKDTIGVCPAKLSAETESEISRMAIRAASLTGCRNYCRVDFRLSASGSPYILEVNANPGISPDSGVIRSARTGGRSYPEFLNELVRLAIRGI